ELSGIGQRTNRDWIAQWLLDPTAHRDSATMPRLLDAQRPSDRQTAVDIAAWLSTLPAAAASPAQKTPTTVAQPSVSGATVESLSGEHLFEDLGCLGCHRLTPSEERDVHRRISLAGIGRKFSNDSLAQFLRRPQAHFAATRMPDFALSPIEATAIAGYLLAASDLPDAKTLGRVDLADVASKADPVRGKEAFAKLGCVQCHAIDTVAASSQPIRIQRFDAGCLAAPTAAPAPKVTDKRGAAPDAADKSRAASSSAPVVPSWSLTDDERAALRKFVATKFSAANSTVNSAKPESQVALAPFDASAETAARMIERLNCHACHTRDARVSQLRDIIAEESSRGIVPEPLPNLTWTGEKLQATWLRSQLAGDLPQRARPWLKARMPAFSRYSETLAAGLMAQHGLPFTATQRDAQNPTTEVIEAGKRLTFANGGLDCRQCHAVGAAQPTGDAGTRIAHGVNFALVGRRLQDDYYRRFLLDPPRYDISTKMPKLAVDGKKTKIADVFGGDAEKQFAAIWAYIKSLEGETR
ncbi:MAG TPA: c-type cytochrome, partial [Pirellulaceae bacterium]|nr:c-type cytochrome [Pirellulaceae bacterium]